MTASGSADALISRATGTTTTPTYLRCSPPADPHPTIEVSLPSVTDAVPHPLRHHQFGLAGHSVGVVVTIHSNRSLEGVTLRLAALAKLAVGALDGGAAARRFRTARTADLRE